MPRPTYRFMNAQAETALPSEHSEHHKAHGENWARWLAPFVGKPGVVGLELGSWKGEGAEWFLDHIFTSPHSRFVCVDTFKGSDEHRLAGIDCSKNEEEARARLARFGERVSIVKGTTDHFLRDYPFPVDFVYIDAAHDAMNVLRDAVLSFDLLRVGGVVVFDDYNWEVMRDELDRPKIAVDAFLDCYARRLEVIGMGWQVAVRKVA